MMMINGIFFVGYRLESNSEQNQGFFQLPEENGNDQGRSSYLFDLKNRDEAQHENNHDPIPCYAVSSSYIICKKLDQLSRRDTGFLRFGRK